MILVIDTSGANSGLALLAEGEVRAQLVLPSGRDFDVAEQVGQLVADPRALSGVMVALGPGSFTGLRQGIAFGVGLAMSLRIPLAGIGSLELTAARARLPSLAVTEAGRGRAYYLTPRGDRGVAQVSELPAEWPVVGWLRTSHPRSAPEADLLSFGDAALLARGSAKAVAYGTVRADYMQEFGRLDSS